MPDDFADFGDAFDASDGVAADDFFLDLPGDSGQSVMTPDNTPIDWTGLGGSIAQTGIAAVAKNTRNSSLSNLLAKFGVKSATTNGASVSPTMLIVGIAIIVGIVYFARKA